MSEEGNKTTIIKAGSQGVASAIMPYAAAGIGIYALLKYLENKNEDFDFGFPDFALPAFPDFNGVTNTVKVTKEKYYFGGEVGLVQGEEEDPYNSAKEDVFVRKTAGKNYMGFGEGTPLLIDSATVTGTGKKSTTGVMPADILNFMPSNENKPVILDNAYNKNLLNDQVSKYGNPANITNGTSKSNSSFNPEAHMNNVMSGLSVMRAVNNGTLKNTKKAPLEKKKDGTYKPRIIRN